MATDGLEGSRMGYSDLEGSRTWYTEIKKTLTGSEGLRLSHTYKQWSNWALILAVVHLAAIRVSGSCMSQCICMT